MFGLTKSKVIVDEEKVDELLKRGVENIFPNFNFLKARLIKGERLSLYLGIDPTGETLHLGHVIPLKKLGEFQKLGHQIILLMGDFTAMIGDPKDKTVVRKNLTHNEIIKNLKEFKKQAINVMYLDGLNPATIKYNSDWFGKM